MNTLKTLCELFEDINDALHKCGARYIDKALVDFIEEIKSENFERRSSDRKISILGWYNEAYLGKGDLLRGLIDLQVLSIEFPDKLQIALWSYYITLDIPEDKKNIFRDFLAKRLES